MDFNLTSAEQTLLFSLCLPFDIARLVSKDVLTVQTDAALKQIQDAAKVRSAILTTLKEYDRSKQYLDLIKRFRGMRDELADSLKTAQRDLA